MTPCPALASRVPCRPHLPAPLHPTPSSLPHHLSWLDSDQEVIDTECQCQSRFVVRVSQRILGPCRNSGARRSRLTGGMFARRSSTRRPPSSTSRGCSP